MKYTVLFCLLIFHSLSFSALACQKTEVVKIEDFQNDVSSFDFIALGKVKKIKNKTCVKYDCPLISLFGQLCKEACMFDQIVEIKILEKIKGNINKEDIILRNPIAGGLAIHSGNTYVFFAKKNKIKNNPEPYEKMILDKFPKRFGKDIFTFNSCISAPKLIDLDSQSDQKYLKALKDSVK